MTEKGVSRWLSLCAASLLLLSTCSEGQARSHSHKSSAHAAPTAPAHSSKTTKRSRSTAPAAVSRSNRKKTEVVATTRGSSKKHRRGMRVTQAEPVVAATHHHGKVRAEVAHAPKPKYAYPVSIFMMAPPTFEKDPLPTEIASRIQRAFEEGHASEYAARSLVRAGVVQNHPLHGGIFWRREPVKYIIVHSTETGIPIGAARVIDSWGSLGRRHAGAQYVVDRDGTIFQAVDPDLATVHVNIFKTLPGINNDNSIGIEMCHTGHQDYTHEQRNSVIHLVSYLQQRYRVVDTNVVTHRYAQQGDHTDPVNFDWDQFIADKDHFKNQAIAYAVTHIAKDAQDWKAPENLPVVPAQPVEVEVVTRKQTTVTKTTTTTRPPANGVPALRGPIEMDPALMQQLNSQPIQQNATPPVAPVMITPETVVPPHLQPAPIQPHLAPPVQSQPQPSFAPAPGSDAPTPGQDVNFVIRQGN